MTGILWAIVAGVAFGVFQAFNRRAGRSIDSYLSTFLLLVVSAAVLLIISFLTEDLSLLRVCDEPEAVTEVVKEWYKKRQVIGTKAIAE